MAQPTNTYDTYDQVGIREDLSDVISNVDPMDTPFYSTASKTKSSSTYHEWQTDSLRSSAANAHIQGDDTTASARTPTVRLGNYTQIFKDAVVVSGTSKSVDHAGRANEMAYQVMKMAKEQKLDIEKALLSNNARVAGNNTTAPELAGVPAWMTSNISMGTGSAANPTGDGTDARTDGTTTALTQTRFNTVMQSIWDNSRSRDFSCFLSSTQMNVALGFAGNNNQRATVAAKEGAVYNVVDVYVTPWGNVDFVMSRENRSRDVMILNMDYWKVATQRATFNEPLSKTGDNEKRQVITELTLEACNQAASGGVFDNT